MNMKKHHIIRHIAENLNVTLVEASKLYNVVIGEIIGSLNKNRQVKLSGFGSFRVINRQPKLGRNPRTGDRLRIPEQPSVKFKMGKHLINSLDGSSPQ